MTSPCPHCGSPLHWVADQGSWACQRCQRWIQPAPAQGGPAPSSGRRLLVFAALGVLAIGGVTAFVVATSSGDEIDCDRYSETVVSIHRREAPDQPGLEEVARRLSAIHGDGCRAGRVSAAQAECVFEAGTMTAVERCLGIEPIPATTSPPEGDTAPPSSATEEAAPMRSDLRGCGPLRALRERVAACDTMAEHSRETYVGMADNKLRILDRGVVPEGAYAENMNASCIRTVAYMREELEKSGCGEEAAPAPP